MDEALDLLVLRASSGRRPPAWRWRLARLLRDAPASAKAITTDAAVSLAMELQTGIDEAADQLETLQILLRVGDAAEAYEFWLSGKTAEALPPPPSGGNEEEEKQSGGPISPAVLARAEIEGLILAGKRPELIAKQMGLSVAAVGWYEQWFFDVRDRLKSPGWISSAVIGNLHRGSPAALYPSLIRAYGYYTRSSKIVRAVTGTFYAAASRRNAKDLDTFFQADARQASGMKAALAARLLPLNSHTYARVIELHHEALDVEAKNNKQLGGTESEEQYKEAVGKLKGNVVWGYGQAPTNLSEERTRPRLVESKDVSG